MDFYNLGGLSVTGVVFIAYFFLEQNGIPPFSSTGVTIMGLVCTVFALLFELLTMRPRFLYAPLWFVGLFPIGYGLYTLGGWMTIPVAPLIGWGVLKVLGKHEMGRVHHMLEVSHRYTSGDPDTLKHEIEENRERREQALHRE